MSNLGITGDNSLNNDFAIIPDVSLESVADRVSPNQIATGVTRGVQYLGGSNVYSDGGNNQIIVADTTPRVLMGNQPTFGEGFYVSKPGINATTNTDPAQWIFNSSQNAFKIVSTGTMTAPVLTVTNPGATYNSGVGITSQAHGLTYIPAIIAYINFSGTYYQLPFNFPWGSGTAAGQRWAMMLATVDNTNINLELDVLVFNTLWNANTAYTIKYYLLQETAN